MESGPLRQLLPHAIHVAEAVKDVEPKENMNPFAAIESAGLQQAAEQRRLEFLTTRCCAHAALEATGVPPEPLLRGSHGQPLWSSGVIGSLTHFATNEDHASVYRGAAVTTLDEFALLGIDAEPRSPLPKGTSEAIVTDAEQRAAAGLFHPAPGLPVSRLVFSIKESFYKARFPVAASWLDFLDVQVDFDRPEFCDPASDSAQSEPISAELDVSGTCSIRMINRTRGHRSLPDTLEGRYLVSGHRILTAVILEARELTRGPD